MASVALHAWLTPVHMLKMHKRDTGHLRDIHSKCPCPSRGTFLGGHPPLLGGVPMSPWTDLGVSL